MIAQRGRLRKMLKRKKNEGLGAYFERYVKKNSIKIGDDRIMI